MRILGHLNAVAEIGGWEPSSPILLKIYAKVPEEAKRQAVDVIAMGAAPREESQNTFLTPEAETSELSVRN